MEFINKPWGFEELLEVNDRYVVKIIAVDGGHRLSKQYHVNKHETMFCLDADKAYIEIGDDKKPFIKGDYYVIVPETVHRIGVEAGGYLTVLECSTPELDDVVRLQDDYKRT